MRNMPLGLAWFLGSVFMLAGLVGAWVMWGANRKARDALRTRVEVQGQIVRCKDLPDGAELGDPVYAIEYTVERHRYQIAAELDARRHAVGQGIALMVLAMQPSDAVVRESLEPRPYGKSIVVFLIGVAVLAWGYVEEWRALRPAPAAAASSPGR